MIGIVDYDFLSVKRRGRGYPSLLAMKYYSYYKQKNKQCILISDLEQTKNCEITYFFTNDRIETLNKAIFQYDNIEIIGEHFNNDVPEIIHHTKPDPTLYSYVIQDMINNKKISMENALFLLEGTYYQAMLNDEMLPLPPINPRKKVFMYDRDFLSYKNCWEILDNIIDKQPSSIIFTSPLYCHTIRQFLTLREDYEKVARSNKIILDYYVPAEEFEAYFGKYKLKLLGEITSSSHINVIIGKNYAADAYKDTFYIKNLIYSLNLLFSYYSRNIQVGVEVFYSPTMPEFYQPIYKAIQYWGNNKDFDMPLEKAFWMKPQKENLKQLLNRHPIFNEFMGMTKNILRDRRGIWRLI